MNKLTIPSTILLVLAMVSCKTLDKNVLIYKQGIGYAPCEPSIAINPTNSNEIVAGSVLNNVHRSLDGGKSWTQITLNSSHGVYGDPALVAGPDGSFYYGHLADPDKKGWASQRLLESIVVQRSNDVGLTWNNGAAVGSNPPKDQDKEWLAVSPDNKYVYMSWTEFDKYNSTDPKDHSRILFSASKDKGDTWSDPVCLSKILGDCIDDDDTVEGAVPAAGKDGRVFVAWAGHENIYFNRSKDYGKTWLDKEFIAANQTGGWVLPIEGLSRVNGMPVTMVDNSGGPYDGRIYILFADQRAGAKNTNVFIISSDDDGDSWSLPKRIHGDQNKRHQYFPWLAIDQNSGFLFAVYYDRNNHADLQNDVSLAWSYDGGHSWSTRVISEKPFATPPEHVFFGDYNNISAANGNVRPIWTRYDEGYLSIWTALIQEKKKLKQLP